MALTFADTHNMFAYITKSDASKGFDQNINFLNASLIKYALTVNLNIYVSCIKQLWIYVLVKKVNDVTRLQALVNKKKVIITKATIRDALRLDDVESIDYLPNEEIFTELSRMGYKKPSTKLTFYKAFFSPQWKFLIHTILQCMSTKRTSWNEFSSSIALTGICLSIGRKFNFSKYIFDSLVRNVDSSTKFYMYLRFLQWMIKAQVSDLSSHTTKYSSYALTQKKERELKYLKKIRTLEYYNESYKECIETLKKKLETLQQEKEGVDGKLAGLLTVSKDLDNLIETQRSDKNKEGLVYSDVPPPIAQIYSSPKKDLSWTGLPEFVDDTVTDYSRPSPTVESTSKDDQNRNPSVSEIVASPITPKPFIKFVKPKDSKSESKTDKKETPKKPPVTIRVKKSFTPKPVAYRPPVRPVRTNMNGISHYRAPWVPTVNRNFPTVNRKLPTGNSNVSTVCCYCSRHVNTARRKAVINRRNWVNDVKASACWVWKPIKSNSSSIILKKYDYVDVRGRSRDYSVQQSPCLTRQKILFLKFSTYPVEDSIGLLPLASHFVLLSCFFVWALLLSETYTLDSGFLPSNSDFLPSKAASPSVF
nr:hypothetical protein [Tanacetum cinerariifolium]